VEKLESPKTGKQLGIPYLGKSRWSFQVRITCWEWIAQESLLWARFLWVIAGYPLDFALMFLTNADFTCVQKFRIIQSFSVSGVW